MDQQERQNLVDGVRYFLLWTLVAGGGLWLMYLYLGWRENWTGDLPMIALGIPSITAFLLACGGAVHVYAKYASDDLPKVTGRALARQLNDEGMAAGQSGNTKEAIAKLKAAIKADPTWGIPWNNLGVVYRDAGDAGAAMKCLAKAVKLGAFD